MTEEEAIQLRKENQELREELKQTQETAACRPRSDRRTGKAENAATCVCQSRCAKASRRRENAAQEARGPT